MREDIDFIDPKFKLLIDKDLEDIVDEINASGLGINEKRLAEHLAEAKQAEADATAKFKKSVEDRGYSFNYNSRKDMVNWFFNILKIPPFKMGKTGPSLDAESLEAIAHIDESAQFYLDAKSAHSLVNILQNITNALRDGRIYPHHNLNKAASGRFSSSGANGDKININGWPKSIRDIFKADDDRITVSFDYKNMEGAVQYFFANEEGSIDDYLSGTDMHQKLADILGVDRKVAKTIRHGIGYGMTAFGLARRIGCTEEEAQEFIDKFWKTQPKVLTMKQDIIRTAHQLGFVSTISGFSRDARGLTDDQIYSTFIQGSAADIFKQALSSVAKYFKIHNNGRIVTPMHDALVCEINEEGIDQTIEDVKTIMQNIHPEMKLQVEVEIGKW